MQVAAEVVVDCAVVAALAAQVVMVAVVRALVRETMVLLAQLTQAAVQVVAGEIQAELAVVVLLVVQEL
jgi:hypothetical protein